MIRIKWIPDTVQLRTVGHEATTEISRQAGHGNVNSNFTFTLPSPLV
jgi:hypothetical protein